MMSRFMRYCVVSRLTLRGCRSTTFSMSVEAKPPRIASILLTVGGSCWWSPLIITRSARSMAAQHAGSRACAASSMKSVEK